MSFLTFNGQALPGVITGLQRPVVARLRTAEVVRGASYSQGGQLGAKRIVITGIIKGPVSLAQQTAALDNLHARLPIGRIAPLVIEAGRSYWAEVESVTETIDPRKFAVPYEVTFHVPSGCAESDTLVNGSWTPTMMPTFTVSGNELTRPQWNIHFGSVATGATFTLSNAATAQTLTFAPADPAIRTLETAKETIVASGVDRTSEWLLGDFPCLLPGPNPLLFTWANCQPTSVSVFYRPRYR